MKVQELLRLLTYFLEASPWKILDYIGITCMDVSQVNFHGLWDDNVNPLLSQTSHAKEGQNTYIKALRVVEDNEKGTIVCGYNSAMLLLGVTDTETWSSRFAVVRKTENLAL